MTLWIILTIMTSAAAVLLSAPFIRRLDRPQAESAGNIEVYRDQLKEIENEQQQGLVDDAQAEMARLEIKKRALAASKTDRSFLPRLSGRERDFAVAGVTAIVVLGSVGLYAATGNPDLPSKQSSVPAQRASESLSFVRESSAPENLVAAMKKIAGEGQGQPQAQAQSEVPPVDEMIRRLETRLLQNPKDGQGWRTLGWSFLNIGRYSEASDAYQKAIELNPNVAEIRSARIEALVRSADGVVTADAKNAIEDTLKIDPKDGRARFFKGLAKEQGGDKASALKDWIEVLKDANPDEAWVSDLKNKISGLKQELGSDDAARSNGPNETDAGRSPEKSTVARALPMPSAIEKGPNPQDVRTAEAMPPEERSAMIRGMVDRLASRLEKSPHDADGWIKLMQSRMVLGDTELAKQALDRGIEAFTDDMPQRERIVAAAQQLGLNR
jgi:cytochrome c-type biogenesis protein CcmH